MNLRNNDSDLLIEVEAGYTNATALVTDRPDSYHPRITLGQIVVMPSRALVNFLGPEEQATRSINVIDALSSRLAEEVRAECGSDCKSSTDTFTDSVPEIGSVVVSAGVVCEKADICGSCPAGIRKDL